MLHVCLDLIVTRTLLNNFAIECNTYYYRAGVRHGRLVAVNEESDISKFNGFVVTRRASGYLRMSNTAKM